LRLKGAAKAISKSITFFSLSFVILARLFILIVNIMHKLKGDDNGIEV